MNGQVNCTDPFAYKPPRLVVLLERKLQWGPEFCILSDAGVLAVLAHPMTPLSQPLRQNPGEVGAATEDCVSLGWHILPAADKGPVEPPSNHTFWSSAGPFQSLDSCIYILGQPDPFRYSKLRCRFAQALHTSQSTFAFVFPAQALFRRTANIVTCQPSFIIPIPPSAVSTRQHGGPRSPTD